MPADAPFRKAVMEHIEFGTQVAMQNSNARTDDELHPLREQLDLVRRRRLTRTCR
jgi:hemoglobin